MLRQICDYFHVAARRGHNLLIDSVSKSLLFAVALGIVTTGPSAAQQSIVRLSGRAMSTTYEVIYAETEIDSLRLHYSIDSLLSALTNIFSTFDPNSSLSAINYSRDTTALHQIGGDFATVFVRARDIYRESEGAYDPAIGPLSLAWGIASDSGSVPDKRELIALRAASKMSHFQLSDGHRPDSHLSDGQLSDGHLSVGPLQTTGSWTLRKSDPMAALDFNGIAKGYAVDKISELLASRGTRHSLVEVGGEIRTQGKHPAGRDWQIAIEYPAATVSKSQTILSISGMSLATSGNYRSVRYLDGHKIVHTLTPQSGLPEANDLLSVTVLASDCTSADAYATALMVMGSEKAIQFLSLHPLVNAYLMIGKAENGFDVFFTPGMKKYLVEETK